MFHITNGRVLNTLPKACLDHLKNGVKRNGFYSVASENGDTLTVYCDFTSEPGSAWTLVTSWSFANNGLNAFRKGAFTADAPLNERTPNWVSYRLSKTKMSLIKAASTHWRSTCSFEKYRVDYKDYMRASFADFDITTFVGGGVCKKVEYINIRGHVGYHSTARFWQHTSFYALHTDSSGGSPCSFNPKDGSVPSEDNFGFYATVNSAFRCTSDDAATTQYWFGGYL